MQYHRGRIQETGAAAEDFCRKVQRPVYVFATAYGYEITVDGAPKFQDYFLVSPAPSPRGVTVQVVRYDFGA